MEYESLLRSVYNCGRGEVKGADADIYRRMEMAERHLTDTHWMKTEGVKREDYRTTFIEVRMYVRKALRDGLEKIKNNVTQEEGELIDDMGTMIHDPNFYNKIELDRIIGTAVFIFFKNGLKAG